MSHNLRRRRTLAALLSSLLLPLALIAFPGAAAADEPIPTSTSLGLSGGTSYGEPQTFTATIISDQGTPTGSVTIRVNGGGVVADDLPVDSNGVAEVTLPAQEVGLVQYVADFHGTDGFADSSGFAFTVISNSGVVLAPEPTIAQLSPGTIKLTLTMSAYARTLSGAPIAGEQLTFSVFGKQPNLFDFGGGTVVCRAVTNAAGFASCKGAGVGGAIVSLLAGGSYVTHFRGVGYDFSSAKAKVLILG